MLPSSVGGDGLRSEGDTLSADSDGRDQPPTIPDAPVPWPSEQIMAEALQPRRMRTGRSRNSPALALAVAAALAAGLHASGAVTLPGVRPPASDPTSYALLFPATDGEHNFGAYDPCRPIHYVVRPDNAPPGADELIVEAVAEISGATGLQFIDDGATAEAPSLRRELHQPARYGERWVPVLIAWSTPAESPALGGKAAGQGGSYPVTSGPFRVLVTGQAILDAEYAADVMARPNGRNYVQALIMHELGHVVGLGHVDDPTQLMYSGNVGITELGAGDRAGLALLGTGPCLPD